MGSVIGYQEAHGPVATFETDVAGKIKNLAVDIYPVQSGSGDPSPDNIRPITGWTGAKMTRAGKNLLRHVVTNVVSAYGLTLIPNDDGSVRITGTPTNGSTPVLLSRQTLSQGDWILPAGTYTINRGSLSANDKVYLQVVPFSGTTLFSRNTAIPYTYAENKSIRFIDIGVNPNDGNAIDFTIYPQLELGSTATAYEPYNGSTYSITFPSAAGTVYGGTLDVVNGELVVDRAQIANYNGETLPGEWISDRDVYAAGASPTTGAQVVYELATPITYQLTPQEISTIIGTNTIYADTGDTSVYYPKTITPIETVSNVNLMELRRNIIAAQGNDILYNKWIWKQEKNDFVVRSNTVGFLEGLGNNIYADQRSDRENNRRSMVVKRGKVPFVGYDSVSGGTHTPVKLYPIPIPPNATSVQMSCDNDVQNLLMGAILLRLENGVYKQIQVNTYFIDISRPLWLITGNHHYLAPYIRYDDNSNFANELKNVKFTFSRIGAPRWTLTDEDVIIRKMNIKWNSNGSYISFASKDNVNNYLTVVTTRGLCGYTSYDGSDLYNVSPFPIPPTATKVTVTTTPVLQAHLILLKCFDNQTQQLITDNGWKTSPVTMTFDADDNLELAVALRINSSASNFTTSKMPTEIIIQFE